MSECSFSCEKFLRFNEFDFLIRTSNSRNASFLYLIDSLIDFDLGEFTFKFKNGENKTYLIPFTGRNFLLNEFWKFLEFVILNNTKAIFPILYMGYEVFIYVEPISKKDIRVIVFDTYDAVNKEANSEIYKYTYADSTIRDDVLIEKKKFVEQFYFLFKNIFEKEDKIVDFEPPLIDYNIWIKDSCIVRKYLKLK